MRLRRKSENHNINREVDQSKVKLGKRKTHSRRPAQLLLKHNPIIHHVDEEDKNNNTNSDVEFDPDKSMEAICAVKSCSNVKVAVRIRPPASSADKGNGIEIVEAISGKYVTICKLGKRDSYLGSQQTRKYEYQFDEAFGTRASQDEVYEKVAKPLVPDLLNGNNVTIFAYGATGSGKTYTMMGKKDQAGIINKMIRDIFEGLSSSSDGVSKFTTYVSYLEVYNEAIRDLLDTSKACEILEENNDVVVKNLTEFEVLTADEALKYLNAGTSNRRTESTKANDTSSRSHAVFQLSLISQKNDDNSIVVKRRKVKMSLIDLAGSERACVTQNRGQRLKEGAHINRSLLALAGCINALASKSRGLARSMRSSTQRVGYRGSKLTHLLKSSLEGDCKIAMIANVRCDAENYDESHNTLKYANRAKSIKVVTSIVEDDVVLDHVGMRELILENQKLKDELSRMKNHDISPLMNENTDKGNLSLNMHIHQLDEYENKGIQNNKGYNNSVMKKDNDVKTVTALEAISNSLVDICKQTNSFVHRYLSVVEDANIVTCELKKRFRENISVEKGTQTCDTEDKSHLHFVNIEK